MKIVQNKYFVSLKTGSILQDKTCITEDNL